MKGTGRHVATKLGLEVVPLLSGSPGEKLIRGGATLGDRGPSETFLQDVPIGRGELLHPPLAPSPSATE
jgi:hypothetical protein